MLRYRARLAVFAFLVLCGSSAMALPAKAQEVSAYRDDYSSAVRAIDRGQWTEYQKLRPGLDDYPLAVYLDYRQLSRQVSKVRPADARRFISVSEDTPLPNRFLSVYLRQAGKDQRWEDFLAVMPDEPNSIDLKCYYFRAVLAQGDKLAAWEGAERLWVHGESRPKQCDPLFNAWLQAGQISDEVVWARMLKAFDARERSLMTYVAEGQSPSCSPGRKAAGGVSQPASLRDQSLPANNPYSAEIASHGLAYLARYNPAQAMDYWQRFSTELTFTAAAATTGRVCHRPAETVSRTEANLDPGYPVRWRGCRKTSWWRFACAGRCANRTGTHSAPRCPCYRMRVARRRSGAIGRRATSAQTGEEARRQGDSCRCWPASGAITGFSRRTDWEGLRLQQPAAGVATSRH